MSYIISTCKHNNRCLTLLASEQTPGPNALRAIITYIALRYKVIYLSI
ncbi:MAG: hypothetical protein OFPI_28710 [Osedax symbiont Rs2]|nr:MAG: hypothetical protein OFPI_28710 [Osedax symbiont Rs2]